MSQATPLVSVIVPVFNGERFLAEALDCIVPAAPIEVIVVDDGSSDCSAAIAAERAPLVRVVRQEHAGLPAARNRGLAEAQGSLLAFLDADDVWASDKIAVQLEALRRHPDVAIVLGRTRRMWAANGADAEPGEMTYGETELALSFGASLLRREVFDRVGRFNETYAYCDDWDWFMRAREMGVPIGVHSEVMLFYRRHEANMTNDAALGNRFFARMLRESVERRRTGGTASLPPLMQLD
jgi:glycosyltransferase involved in cell wall biosynthesis